MVCIIPLSQIHTVLVRVFQRNGTTRMCIYRDLFQGIDSHDCGESVSVESNDSLGAEFPLVQGKSVFVLLRSSTDGVRPTCIMEGNLLYSKAAGLDTNLIQKTPSQK